MELQRARLGEWWSGSLEYSGRVVCSECRSTLFLSQFPHAYEKTMGVAAPYNLVVVFDCPVCGVKDVRVRPCTISGA